MRLLRRLKVFINSCIKIVIHTFGTLFIRPFIGRPDLQALDRNKPYRILYVCLAFRGDLVVNFPAITEIKRHFPNSKLTCWVRGYNKEMAALLPAIDEIIVNDDFKNNALQCLFELTKSKKYTQFVKRLGEFDVYIDDSGHVFSAIMGFRAKIAIRIGRNFQGFGFLYHREISYDLNVQMIERRLKFVRAFGHDIKLKNINKPYFKIQPELIESVQKKLSLPSGLYFTVQPFAGWESKNWGLEKYVKVAEKFAEFSRLKPVFLGSMAERKSIDNQLETYSFGSINSAGLLGLDESAALIAGARLHLGGDSIGGHLAIALDVRSITIFGPTNPGLSAYLGGKNIGVYKKTRCTPKHDKLYCCFDAGRGCQHKSCMRQLREEDVLQGMLDLWNGKELPAIIQF